MDKYIFEKINGIKYAIKNKEYEKYQLQKKYKIKLIKSGIPTFYHSIDWDDYIGDKSINNVNELKLISKNIHNEQFKDVNFYLWGEMNGTQKTSIICNFGKECIRQGLKVRFLNFGVFVNYLIKNQGFNIDEEAEEELQKIKKSDIILLDDCFDPKKSLSWGKNDLIISELDNYFRTLIYNNKRFVLTSNLSLNKVKETYGISLYELLDRNFKCYEFLDSVSEIRKKRFKFDLSDLEK